MGKEVGNGGLWLLAFLLVLHSISVILYKPMHWASISLQFLTLKMGQIVSTETLVSGLTFLTRRRVITQEKKILIQ